MLEVLSYEAVDDVTDIGSFKFKRLLLLGEGILYINVLACEVEDLLDGQPTVEGHVDGTNIVKVYGNLLVREDVLQECNLHSLNRWQVEFALVGDEPVDL